MKFKFKISKWANFYSFVHNLSMWHFSCREQYNIFWKEKLGDFTTQEKEALKEFKKIRLKYPDAETGFEKAFFLSQSPFEELTESLPEKELQTIKDTFSALEDKFELLYKEELPLLKKWQKILSKTANDKKVANKIVKSLNVIYKTSVKKETVDVYLLFSTVKNSGGGANIGGNNVSLELSRLRPERMHVMLCVLWHETCHAIFQDKNLEPLLSKYFNNNEKKILPIREIITGSLFSLGILGMRFLIKKPVIKPKCQSTYKTTIEQTIEILHLTKEYLDKNKHFDNNYIKKLELIMKKA